MKAPAAYAAKHALPLAVAAATAPKAHRSNIIKSGLKNIGMETAKKFIPQLTSN
jgi:hypothetical protein